MSNVNFIAGIPGAGKTALLLDLLLKEVIPEKRPIFIDQRLNPTTGVFGPSIPDLNIPHQIIGDITKWHEPGMVPDGACLVVDEAQDIWPLAPSGAKLTPDLLAMNRIRQRGITLYFTSQRPNMMHSHVRGLVGRYILLRDRGLLGRGYYEWTEFPEHPLAFKSAPQQKTYKLPKHVFGLYRSSTMHVKHAKTIPRSVIVLGVCTVALAGGAWYAYSSIYGKIKRADADAYGPAKPGAAPGVAPGGRPTLPAARSGPSGRVPAFGVSAPVKDREPYAGLGLHMAGTWEQDGTTRTTFTASVDGRAVAVVRDTDLQKAGYAWRILAPCAGLLIFGERERVVTCDAPSATKMPAPPMQAASAPA